MKLLFCSSVFQMSEYDYIAKKSKVPASLADHNLNYNVIVGLDANMPAPVTLINNVPIPTYPKFPRVIFRKKAWSHTIGARDIHCGFINLPVLKHISRAITTYNGLKKEIQSASGESVVVMTYDLKLGICLAIRYAKKKFPQIRTCAVLPDVPNAVIVASNGGKVTLAGRLRAGIKMGFIGLFDSYVLLTEYMQTLSVLRGKPSVLMEGIYNNQQAPLPEKTTTQKVILYSGQLNPAYGIENLLEAFQEIYKQDQSYALWICGAGALTDRIKSLSETCSGIRYYGYVNAQTVRKLQAEASVLINPRQNTGEFTKYSFPSKTMEYLASGRPVIGYKLDGIPDEYDAYIQYVADNTVEALRDKIMEVCSISKGQRQALGERSRQFILKHKNPKKQCALILAMLEGLLKQD